MKLTSNRKMMLLVLLAFLLPVILAKLALEFDWFNKAATNKGELLEPVVDLSALDSHNKWRILYLLPEHCDEVCDNALYSINQVWKALGREQHRAEPVVLVTEHSDKARQDKLSEDSGIRRVRVEAEQISAVFKARPTDGIFLVDTLNNVILHYPVAAEKQQAVLDSRNILADLRKLLKLSRIG
jgi:cytochrome oxidase Cu insertion factor (SCO1/SenC/PrrC family)